MKIQGMWLILFLTCSYSYSQSRSEEEIVMGLSADKFRWIVNKQLDSLESMLHERVTYIHSNGWSQNKKEIIDDLRTGKTSMKSIEIQSSTARLFNQTAIVNGQGKFVGDMNGTPFTVDLIYTEGYIKEKEKWLLVSRLATKVIK
jgi:hypothetical protein